MKKLLALVLALVMSMSLVTISNAAFKDADKISNKEAVDVMAAVGVLAGYDNGEFGATDTLTRAQACKIIAYLDLGKDVAEALPAVQVFSDLSANNWAAKYVAYCADAGYVSGVGDNKFAPDEKVTGYQFGKMLLCALGYDATIEEMTGASWTIKVAKLMEKNSISKGTSKLGAAVLTREEAAQYALNALKATMVEYDEKGSTITAGDVTIVTGAQKAKNVTVKASTGTNEYARAISGEAVSATPTDMTVELGEKLYKGDLTLGVSSTSTDAYGRPATTWQYKGTDVASDISSAKVTFSADLTSANGKKQIASDLKGYKFNGTELKTKDTEIGATTTSIDSLTFSAATDKIVDRIAALTANGKVVEFYADSNKNITDVVVISYTVAKVTNVTTNKKGDVTYAISGLGNKVDYADDYANTDTIAVEGTVAKNDYVLYVQDVNESTLYHVYAATKVTGQQTATDGTALTIGGTKYKLGKGVAGYNSYTYANSSKEANYFLDKFGYVVASSDVEADLVYAVVNKIVGKETTTGLSTGKSAEAELILTDGSKTTVKVSKINGIEVKNFTIPTDATAGAVNWNASHDVTGVTLNKTVANNSALNGQIVSYTVDDGKYELTFAETPASVTTAAAGTLTNKGVPGFGVGQTGANSGTNSTVYVVKTYKSGTTDEVVKSYTGFANVPTIAATAGNTLTAKYVIDDGKVVFVYIDATTNSAVGESTTDNVFYVTSATVTTNGTGSDKYYTVNGILDGTKTTIKSKVVDFKVLAGSNAMSANAFYTLSVNEDGYVTSAAPTSFSANGTADQALIDSIADGTFGGYLTNDKTKVYVIDDGEVTEGAPAAIAIGDAWNVMLKTTGTAAEKNTIETLYIVVA